MLSTNQTDALYTEPMEPNTETLCQSSAPVHWVHYSEGFYPCVAFGDVMEGNSI